MHLRQNLNAMKHAATVIATRGAGYARTLIWLIRDSGSRQFYQWRIILIAAALNLISNAAIVAVIFLYARLLQENIALPGAWFTGNARDSMLLLALVVSVIAAAFTIYAASEYVARSTALRLARTYQERVFRRVMHRFLEPPAQRKDTTIEILERVPLRSLAINYGSHSGWALRFIANALPALGLVAFAFCSMLWLNPLITALLSALGVLVVAAQYPANLFAAASTSLADRSRPKLVDAFRGLQDVINRTPTLPGSGDVQLRARIDVFFSAPEIARHMDANENRFRAMELSSLTTQIGGALMMVTLLALIGVEIVRDQDDWAILAAYIAVLRLFVSNMTSVLRAITIFSRFYPYIKDLHLYLEQSPRESLPTLREQDPLYVVPIMRLNAPEVDGGASGIDLPPGSVVALRALRGYGRDLLTSLEKVLSSADATRGFDPRCELVLPPPEADAIAQWATTANSDDRARWISTLGRGAVAAALEKAVSTNASVLVLDRIALEALDENDWANWRRRLATRVVIIVYAETFPPHPRIRPELGPDLGESRAAALRDFDESLFVVHSRDGTFVWSCLPASGIDRSVFSRLHSRIHANSTRGIDSSIDDDTEIG